MTSRAILNGWPLAIGQVLDFVIPVVPPPPPVSATLFTHAQGMGATDDNGYVARFPLHRGGVARLMFVDSVNGNDANNGYSPYSGFRANGTGAFFQYDATAQGVADAAYGPKKTIESAEKALPQLSYASNDPGVGHQILLAEGGLYQDLTTTAYGSDNRASRMYGLSPAFPRVMEAYDPTQPWNFTRTRPTGSKRPIIRLSTDKVWNFNSYVNNGGGRISNFAIRDLQFQDSTGARIAPDVKGWGWENIDSDNILLENIDFGGAAFTFSNTSDVASFPRYSRNLIIRKCLIQNPYSVTNTRAPGAYLKNVIDWVIEDCVFDHCAWVRSSEDRYVSDVNGGPTIFRHDVYADVRGACAGIHRRNVSFDAAATHLSCRGNTEAYHNWVIDAPIALISAGGVSDITTERPNGNYFDHHHNLVMGSQTLNAPSFTVTAQPTPASSVLRVGNVEFEFVNSGNGATTGRIPITLGANVAGTVANIVTVLNGRSELPLSRVTYRAAGSEVRQTLKKSSGQYVFVETYGPGLSIGDPGVRSWAYAATNGVPEAMMRDSLIVNSGFIGNTGNAAGVRGELVMGPGRTNGQSFIKFLRNLLYAWGPNLEADSSRIPANTTPTYAGNVYNATSPISNDDFYAAMGYASKDALRAAVCANFEQPWALRALAKATELTSFSFALPSTTAPSITASFPASTQTPKVGDTVTFPNPTISGGAIVAATTCLNNLEVAGTGVSGNTLTITSGMVGKRLSRTLAIAPTNGGPITSLLTEVTSAVVA